MIHDYKSAEFSNEYIAYWHTPDVGKNTYYIEPSDKIGGYKLSIEEDGSLKATDLYINKEYIIE